jgi:Family of unknown function (DUF6575)
MYALDGSKELGLIEVLDVYVEHDGPRLFSCKDSRGQSYVAVWVDESDSSDVWLYAAVSRSRLNALEADTVDLRSIFSETESGKVLQVTTFHDQGSPLEEPVNCSEIPEEWLPMAGASLSGSRVE